MKNCFELFDEYEKKFNEPISFPYGDTRMEEFLKKVEECVSKNKKFDWEDWEKELPENVII